MRQRYHPKARRRARKLLRGLAVAALILAFTGTVVFAFFLFPPRNDLAPTDAIVVLAGSSDGRHQRGAELVEKGVSSNFVVSNPNGLRDVNGSLHCRGTARPRDAEETWCLRPEPVTTVGEARAVEALANREGWSSVTVVTNRPHARRAHTVFAQCTDLDLAVVPIDHVVWDRVRFHITWEIGGYLKFWLTNPC